MARDAARPIIQLTGDSEPDLFAGLDPTARRPGRPERRAGALPAARHRAPHQLGDRLGAEPGLGGGRLRRARPRAALGRGRDGDAPRRGRSRGRVAGARRDAQGARGGPRRARASTRSASAARAPTSSSACSRPRAGCARRSRPRSGIEHIPNLPTEEVFTSPDWRRTEGTVRSTYPLVVPGIGARVEGLRAPVRGRAGSWTSAADGDGADVIRASSTHDDQAPYPRRGRARRRRLARPADRARLPQHALRRERHLPHRLRQRACRWRSTEPTGSRADELLELGVNVSACTPTS